MTKPSYYAIIPANIRYDNRLKPNEKLMYGEITALSGKNGVCFASNNYFAKLYQKTNQTITVWISHLKSLDYIQVKTFRRGMLITKRCISITPISNERLKKILNRVLRKKRIGYLEKSKQPIKKNLKENNTSDNTIKTNSQKKAVNDLQKLMVQVNDFVMQEVNEWFKTYSTKLIFKAIQIVGTRNPNPKYVMKDIDDQLRNGCQVKHYHSKPNHSDNDSKYNWKNMNFKGDNNNGSKYNWKDFHF